MEHPRLHERYLNFYRAASTGKKLVEPTGNHEWWKIVAHFPGKEDWPHTLQHYWVEGYYGLRPDTRGRGSVSLQFSSPRVGYTVCDFLLILAAEIGPYRVGMTNAMLRRRLQEVSTSMWRCSEEALKARLAMAALELGGQ